MDKTKIEAASAGKARATLHPHREIFKFNKKPRSETNIYESQVDHCMTDKATRKYVFFKFITVLRKYARRLVKNRVSISRWRQN